MTDPSSNDIDPRQIDYLPLSSLEPDPRNPKAHDQDTIDASIGRFGMLDLIVRDGRTGFIISGHGRRKALTTMAQRGESAPEGVKVDPASGEWLVPVVVGWSSRTDLEAGAALIALNRTTELGGWVDDALLELLDDLQESGDEGLAGVGFTAGDIEDLGRLLSHQHEDHDLEELADVWDGESGLAAREPEPLAAIIVRDERAAETWLTHRAQYADDDEALLALLFTESNREAEG